MAKYEVDRLYDAWLDAGAALTLELIRIFGSAAGDRQSDPLMQEWSPLAMELNDKAIAAGERWRTEMLRGRGRRTA